MKIECLLHAFLSIESYVAGNKTFPSGVVCVVTEEGVCWQQRGGDFARAPWHVIPGRGLHQTHGQCESSRPTTRTPLGAALFVPCRPRDRMGLSGPAWKHARHQRQRNVYRGCRSALGGCGFQRAPDARASCETRLFCETDRAGQRHGRVRSRIRDRKPEALSGPTFLTRRHQLLIPFYTKSDDTLP
jgi:hypothetical protein